jgi:hypothetical protein
VGAQSVAVTPAPVETQAELAELAKLTPARVTQFRNVLGLAPDIQEDIFVLPPVTEGQPAVTERHLRQVLKTVVWSQADTLASACLASQVAELPRSAPRSLA